MATRQPEESLARTSTQVIHCSKLEHARVVMFHSSMEKESGQVCIWVLTVYLFQNIYLFRTDLNTIVVLCLISLKRLVQYIQIK